MVSAIKKKVNRIGLVGQIVSVILIVLTAVAIAALIAATVLFLLMPKDAVLIGFRSDFDVKVTDKLIGPFMDEITEEGLSEVNADISVNGREYGDVSIEKLENGILVSGSSERITLNLSRVSSALIAALIYSVTLLVVFIFLKRLSDGFHRCDTPFSDDVVSRMTTFAWVLLIGSVISSVAQGVANTLIARSTELEFSVNPAGMNTGFHFSFNSTPILIALLVLFLVMIFRYGAQLQKEADETL